MNRRQTLTAGVGAAAAAAGGLAAWWQLRPDEDLPDGALDGFWQQILPRPEGGQIALAEMRQVPWVLNFWATWCAPCVRELPEIDRFASEYRAKGWSALALAIDRPEAVKAFLAKLPLKLPVAIAGSEGFDWLRLLGDKKGALPYSVVFRPGGAVVWRKLGTTDYAELVEVARRIA